MCSFNHVLRNQRPDLGAREVKRPEQALQQQVVAFMNLAAPGLLFWHTPNQSGRRSPVAGAILKSMGVRAGVPDITILLPTGKAAFIELKAGNGRLTEGQQAFRADVERLGCPWAEARSLADVEAILNRWLSPLGWTLKARAAA
jgi:hypothetical protein